MVGWMSGEPKITDEELAKLEKQLLELPEDVRKYYEKDVEKKLKRGRAEYAIPPIEEEVEIWFIYDEGCPHCTALMQSRCYEAIVRYAWARGITFKAVTAQESMESLLFSVIWPERSPDTIIQSGAGEMWSPIHTPMLVVIKNRGKLNEEVHHVVVNSDLLKDKPHHYFYWVQMKVEGQILIPTLTMAMAVRKLQSDRRKRGRRKTGEDLKIAPEDETELSVPRASSPPENPTPGEVMPCEAQPRC
jgi:hypothetical protein